MSDDPDPRLTRLLPASIDGWNALEDHLYNRENLYEYINGGAELYLSYGFQSVLSRTYFRIDQPKIIVDLFDMRESANAFGVFCHTREVVDTTFGQGSQYFPGLLTFWKDHYYVSILASPETPESKQGLEDLAREGGMANTFLNAAGVNIGTSLAERDMAEKARAIGEEAHRQGSRYCCRKMRSSRH